MKEMEVEDKFIEDLKLQEYEFVDLKNYNDVLENFKKQLCKFNSSKLIKEKGKAELSDKEFEKVMFRLNGKNIYDSAKILREKMDLTLDNGKSVYLDFICDDYNQNIFQVAHQITMDKEHNDDVVYKNRYDVTILINGLPLIQIELKRPGVEINEAINQINRYRRFSFTGLFKYIQFFVISNKDQTKYIANTNEIAPDGSQQHLLKSLAFYWTDEINNRINNLSDFTKDFFQRCKITELITKFMVIKEKEPVIMIMRPYQIYAVKRSLERIDLNSNGYCFAATGSGKTLTSFKLAQLLITNKNIEKIFFLIDRKDLDDQTVDEYNSFEENCVDSTDNTRELVKALNDSTKKLIVTTIQKMSHALNSDKYKKYTEPYKTKKCVFIIDECHRSQFGKMHHDIEKHFENANFIGFTGTPIFKENKNPTGRTTADIFNAGNLDPCIHKYMIKEAIADGNVLKFSVEFMKNMIINKVNNQDIDVNRIEDPEYCKEHKINIDKLYHDPERIKLIAKDILDNLDKHVKPNSKDVYTALFAVDRISTLMDYYHEFKKINTNKKIAAIFTYKPNEDLAEGQDKLSQESLQECIDDYNAMFGTKFDISTFDAYRKDISKRLKQKDLPQVDMLLVVDMFLTGFDSKVTNTLILDKSLVWHNLVQAYSRTNRVDKESKQYGQVISYRYIKKAQDEALALFSGSGNADEYLLESYEYYVSKYITQTEELRKVCPTPEDAGNVERIGKEKEFVIKFRDLACTLMTLKTFSKFDWNDISDYLDNDEFDSYKSFYADLYRRHARDMELEKTTLTDVDFKIELIRTDKINVIYILNLLKEVNKTDKNAIDLIIREIDRSDNEKLGYKKELMKKFIREKFLLLDKTIDIELAYEEYEKNELETEIKEFCFDRGLDSGEILKTVNNYFCDKNSLSNEKIRKQLALKKLGIKRITELTKEIVNFIHKINNKYTAEGK